MKKSALVISASAIGVVAVVVAAYGATSIIAGEFKLDDQLKSIESKLQALASGKSDEVKLDEKGLAQLPKENKEVNDLRVAGSRLVSESLARPDNERETAIANIKKLINDENAKIEYGATAPSSYNGNIMSEFYMIGDYYAEVSMNTNEVVQYGPAAMETERVKAFADAQAKRLESSEQLSKSEIEKKAADFISKNAQNIDLSTLKLSEGEKSGTNFFFRWTGIADDGHQRTVVIDDVEQLISEAPFIQVGFNTAGELLSFTISFALK